MVEGFISIESLIKDSFYFDDHEIAIVGRKYKEIYRLGSEIEIQVKSVNLDKRRVPEKPHENTELPIRAIEIIMPETNQGIANIYIPLIPRAMPIEPSIPTPDPGSP